MDTVTPGANLSLWFVWNQAAPYRKVHLSTQMAVSRSPRAPVSGMLNQNIRPDLGNESFIVHF